MTETEKLELQLYERYVSILKNKKQEIKIEIRRKQNKKMKARYGEKYDPEEYWTSEKLEKLKDVTKSRFEELCRTENLKDKLVEQAIKEFCDEINSNLLYTQISVKKKNWILKTKVV